MKISRCLFPFANRLQNEAYKRNFWAVRPKAAKRDLFYVLAYIPRDLPNEFFVMTQEQVNEAIEFNWTRYCARHGLSGRELSENPFTGIEWQSADPYRDKWEALPS